MPKVLGKQARRMVVQLYDHFERENQNGGPLIPVTQVRERVADALNINKCTVSRIVKERYGTSGMETNIIRSPNKRQKTMKPVTGIDNFDTAAIRNHIYGYYTRKEYPKLKKLAVSLKAAGLFNGCVSSLRKVLKNIGFRYMKVDQRKLLLERSDIAQKRITFLRKMAAIENWQNVVFLDETWLNANHTVSKTWSDGTQASTSKVPMGKGARLIICHAGSAASGFIDNSLLAFESKSTKEYHEEMNAEKFQEWFLSMLQNLPDPSVIVMDNATYHSVQIDKPPTKDKNKAEMLAWLQKNGVAADMSMLKVELWGLVEQTKTKEIRYLIDEMAMEHGHEVVRLPPYHCQYNAIELIWAQIKGYAARNNTEPPFTTKKMLRLLKEACEKVTRENWHSVVERTKKIILDDFKRDVTVDIILDKEFVINVNDSSSSASDDSDVSDPD